MEKLWAKLVGGNKQPKRDKKEDPEKKRMLTVDKKSLAATSKSTSDEKKPLLEDKANEDEDDEDDVFVNPFRDSSTDSSNKETGGLDVLDEDPDYAFTTDLVRSPVPGMHCLSIWNEVMRPSTQLQPQEQLNILTLGKLKTHMKLSERTTLLYHEQHVSLVTAYYEAAEAKKFLAPFTKHLAISVSFTDIALYSDCVNNGLITAAPATVARGRIVFCIKPVTPLGTIPYVRYGHPLILQLTIAATPLYLAIGDQLGSDNSYSVRLSTRLNNACYFQFITSQQEEGGQIEPYPVPSHASFLVQHVESKLFLTFKSFSWVVTNFGYENVVRLEPIEYIDKRIAKCQFFKAFLKETSTL